MSDLNVTVTPVTPLEPSKEGVVAPFKDKNKTVEAPQPVKHEQKIKVAPAKVNDFNYAINREDNSIHLTVKSSNGDVVREVVFERIDPNLLDPKKLKGILVDSN